MRFLNTDIFDNNRNKTLQMNYQTKSIILASKALMTINQSSDKKNNKIK